MVKYSIEELSQLANLVWGAKIFLRASHAIKSLVHHPTQNPVSSSWKSKRKTMILHYAMFRVCKPWRQCFFHEVGCSVRYLHNYLPFLLNMSSIGPHCLIIVGNITFLCTLMSIFGLVGLLVSCSVSPRMLKGWMAPSPNIQYRVQSMTPSAYRHINLETELSKWENTN